MRFFEKKTLLLIAIKTILLAISYEFVFRSLLLPRLEIFGFFFVIVLVCELIEKKIVFTEKISFRHFNRFEIILISTVILLCTFSFVFVHWALGVFPLDNADRVIMTLRMPVEGFTSLFVVDFFKSSSFFGIVLFLFTFFFFIKIFKFYKNKKNTFLIPILCFLTIDAYWIGHNIPQSSLKQYVEFVFSAPPPPDKSQFFEDNFTPVQDTLVSVDGNTKNLIVIFLESIENNFFEYMPELKKIAQENYSFNNGPALGGGYSVVGTTFTMSSIIANTTGLPLLFFSRAVEKVSNSGAYIYFPNQKSIYDILHNYDYKNVFLQGTSSSFAGKRSFFVNHGIDQIYDVDNIELPKETSFDKYMSDFHPGFSDRTLFDVAKSILDTISDKKFSLTMLTVDTHFPHGFLDEKCPIKPSDKTEAEVYKAILKCTSLNVASFVDWVKQQPYGENTMIVLIGDHPFMGNMLVEGVAPEDRKFVNVYINPQRVVPNTQRTVTAFDTYPTILEGMGFLVNGGKLAFGQSLFSENETLIEKMGKDSLERELKKIMNSKDYQNIL